MGQQNARNNGACVEADGAPREEIAAVHGDEVGGTRPRAYEMHGHGADPVSASAHVACPTAMRGSSSFASGPPAARAAASATDGTPLTARARSERVSQRAAAASRSRGGTNR